MLTKKTLEVIKHRNARDIQQLEKAIINTKECCVDYWLLATPETRDGEHYFAVLNIFKAQLSKLDKELKQLRLAQKEVKTAIAYHVEWARYVNETTKYEGETK